jgi:hypothetical protein
MIIILAFAIGYGLSYAVHHPEQVSNLFHKLGDKLSKDKKEVTTVVPPKTE